jgi:hypothetical protein
LIVRAAMRRAHRGPDGCEVNNTMYSGGGVEIEDDVVRLRQRKVEFEGDAARLARRAEPRLRRGNRLMTGAMLAVIARLARRRQCLP